LEGGYVVSVPVLVSDQEKTRTQNERDILAHGEPILDSVLVAPTSSSNGIPVSLPIPPQHIQPSDNGSQNVQKSKSTQKQPVPDPNEPPKLNKVTVCFKQYKEFSPWFKVTMVVGSKEPIRSMGGYVGGMRRVNLEEQKQWLKFFPEYEIL